MVLRLQRFVAALFAVVCLAFPPLAVPAQAAGAFKVTPAAVALEGNFARLQLLVAIGEGDRSADLTHKAQYQSSLPGAVSVSASGQLVAAANGEAVVTVTIDQKRDASQ